MPVAPVAQLDRASGFEPEGREFESLRARQFLRHFVLRAFRQKRGSHVAQIRSDRTRLLAGPFRKR